MSNKTVERKLPNGIEEFEQLITDLRSEYELPTEDVDSIKFGIATTIMHLGPLDSHKTLEFFYKTLVAGAAKQIAHSVFRGIKERQVAAQQNTPAAIASDAPQE